jgi:ribosomal-protein-alanine N-acetyltransferase
MDRVYLRSLETEDYKKTHEWRKDPGYREGVLSMKRYTSEETEQKWIQQAIESHERGEAIRLGVVLKDTDELIGLVYLTEVNHVHKRARSGWWIGPPEYRGKGYMTEARRQLLQYAFNELDLRRIEARILEGNESSKRSAEKGGFTKEGVLRKYVYKNGQENDVGVYSILRSEYREMYGGEG